MRWANGAGTTHEIVAKPSPEGWEWRLSLAEVHEDGPFSELPGVDRALVVASGNGMTLRVGDEETALQRFEGMEFPGEAATSAQLKDGMVRDLNLMVRRDSGRGRPLLRVQTIAAGQRIDIGRALALVVLDGAVTMTTPVDVFPFNPVQERASRFDAFLIDAMDQVSGPTLHAMGATVVAFAELTP